MDLKAKRADKPHLEADRPEIGQKVRVRAVAHPTDGRIRKWESYPCDPFEGVFVGVRFKRNGYTTQDTDFEATIHEAPYFVCQKTVEVWLVAYSKFHDPKCVLPEDCEVLPDEPDQGKSYLVIEKGF